MKRQLFRWQLKNDAGTVVNSGACFAWNAAIRRGQDALRDVPGRGMFERDGFAVYLGDVYAQRWSGHRGTFTVEVRFTPTIL